METSDIAVIGLGVMGQNLALNLLDNGFRVTAFDVNPEQVARLKQISRAEGSEERLLLSSSLPDLIASLALPRKIILLVPAGPAVDSVCDELLSLGVEEEDILVDLGNSLWTDTIGREQKYRGRCYFFGAGISGGEVGARFGAALMPSGDVAAWHHLAPLFEAVAAKVDPATDRSIERFEPGNPVTEGEPCTAYIGPAGAGHYVKMVHNGIEYADMQLICEAYQLLRSKLGHTPAQIGEVFARWNQGRLSSYLVQITADILQHSDPKTGQPLVDMILDKAGQKGTGRWTAINALESGVPVPTVTAAVFERAMSALKDERQQAAGALSGPQITLLPEAEHGAFIDSVEQALYCARVAAYAQGFALMSAAEQAYGWQLNFEGIAKAWRGGCIIRAVFLGRIAEAYRRDPALKNLLLDSYFADQVGAHQAGWRQVAALAVTDGISVPGFLSALGYYDSFRSATLPANLLQAQRDYFGAHTYERTDRPSGEFFHTDWSGSSNS